MIKHLAVSALSLALLSACSTTQAPADSRPAATAAANVQLLAPPQADQPLTLQQIMADPDWMGIRAQGAYFADDGQSVYYSRQPSASVLKDYYQLDLDNGSKTKLELAQLHSADQRVGVLNNKGTEKAYLYQGNLFVKDLASGKVRQLTRSNNAIKDLRYLNDGSIAYWQGGKVSVIDTESGLTHQLAQIETQNAPKGVQEPDSYLAKQQHRLIKYVALQHDNAKDKEQRKQALLAVDPTMAAEPFYVGKGKRIAELSVSPDGRYILLALSEKSDKWRSDHDIMPDYLGKDGYVDAVPARARVAEAKSSGHSFLLLDTQEGTQKPITIEGLTGYDEDVLAKVKSENAAAQGEEYDSEKSPRTIALMLDWGWSQSPVQWHSSDNKLALMVEALDNKDRWIATVDLDKGKFSTQHRLHDDAWVNYTHNQYGWLPDTDTLYYLSEESGYSHLYLKPLGGKAKALTQGPYVVSDITLSPDAKYIYYRANKQHPGIYNVYRVELASGKDEQLTQWDGNLEYELSPQGDALLLNASRRTEPAELYLQPIGGEMKKLTDYTSNEFKSYPWQAPEVVAVPSSHGAEDIYARVYLPAGFNPDSADKYPAVIFNHGAGYLQNADYGFSGYFREFMFHNLLAQQGYVVMDMDYRGSKGYGRDWRTAVYRNMGKPEVEDLSDGVKWMAKHANVDAQRAGTYGGSYGGFLTFMALFTQPELFQSGAALRPVTDWAHYNAPYTSNILNTPDVDPIAYERSSPIEHAEGLQKPLLIMSGVLDDNVFFQDSVRLVQRLIELEKPMFETAIYPVEPHGFKQPSSWLDEYRRIHKLFEETLKE
ncbi:prolyl oligopeptidase family serine peptidase [Shewanella corallii]|uniref:Prolyl oligopeptidase family serine peptidase n=1 Tax=Shewanella corallii TaxID=560080 RepID=A0ABT0NBX7_9GAMM|nr:prolyl oligopeptidase family serine peptidase [Shewanella corallii]MCL2915973.1 prolyl oligopeptidase family serine peptidase [Shewanella corallii]